MNCVYDIRGTNGSGKSTIVRKLLSMWYNELVLDSEVPYHYIPALNLCVLGRYDRQGSGVDNVKGSDRLQDFMRKMLVEHDVLLEGVIVSHVFGRWNDFADEGICNYKFYYIDIPVELAIERVKDRREAAGKDREYDPKNTIKFYDATNRVISKLREAGKDVTNLDGTDLEEEYDWLLSDIMESFGHNITEIDEDLMHRVLDIRGVQGSGKTAIVRHLCKNAEVIKDPYMNYYKNGNIAVIHDLSKKFKRFDDTRILMCWLFGLSTRYHIVFEGIDSQDKRLNSVILQFARCVGRGYTLLYLADDNEECYRRKNRIVMKKTGTPYDKFLIVQERKALDKLLEKFLNTEATMLVQNKRTKEDNFDRVTKILKKFS